MTGRIGVFGGTFDPPHVGHLILASEARFQLGLTRLLWVLTAIPPHKLDNHITGLDDRLAMVQLAIADEPAFELSRVDIDRQGPHYTLDTLKLLRQEHPGEELILVIGGDSLRDLPTWHLPREVMAACDEIGVMRRPDDHIDLPELDKILPGLGSKLHFIEAPLLDIASHEIRERAAKNLPFKYYVPQAVHKYIAQNRLYQPH